MIALDFNDSVLHRAAGAAQLFQALRLRLERFPVQRQAADQGDALALPALGLARDPHLTVAKRPARGLLPARAGGAGPAAVGTKAAGLGGIDGAGSAHGRGSCRMKDILQETPCL